MSDTPTYTIGQRVFVIADNVGSPASIVAHRDGDHQPPTHWQVRTDTGDTFWAFDFEITPYAEGSHHASR